MRSRLAIVAVGGLLIALAATFAVRREDPHSPALPSQPVEGATESRPVVLQEAAHTGRAEVSQEEEDPAELRASHPEPSEEVEETTGSQELWFLVMDPADDPLLEAAVTVSWDGGSKSATPREEDGLVWMSGVPEGVVTVEARCPGYARFVYQTSIPWNPPRIEGIALEPAAELTGHVVRGDEVPEGLVEVVLWRNGREAEALLAKASGERQAFRFQDAPAGEVLLAAISSRWGRDPSSGSLSRPDRRRRWSSTSERAPP